MNIFPQKMIFGNFTQRIRTMKTDLGNITNVTKKLRAEREERKREGREETEREGERTEIERGGSYWTGQPERNIRKRGLELYGINK